MTSAGSPTPLLAVANLRKAYGGVQAVRDVSFTLAPGEILALIGPNGAGKSTCFNMLNGQVRPDGGTIRIGGADVTRLSPRGKWSRGVGRTFQVAATFGSMSVRENVQMGLMAFRGRAWRPFGKAGTALRNEAAALLDHVGLATQWYRPCAELAYGELKRLELAMALTNRPSLLLMDEPTAGMALRERVELMRFTAKLARGSGIGVLFTEHDMDIVFEHADRVMVLDRGDLIAQGPPAVVRSDRRVRAIYLGEGEAPGPATDMAAGA